MCPDGCCGILLAENDRFYFNGAALSERVGSMEFHDKLKELRKRKGLTQEELADRLYVSRTAVSKWESGRGYPNIDSLRDIARFFSVTLDELLSGEELLSAAEEEQRCRARRYRSVVFGLLDLSAVLCWILPLFAQTAEGQIAAVSLLGLVGVAPYMRAIYLALTGVTVVWGILALLWRGGHEKAVSAVSLICSALGVLLFIGGSQPYAAAWFFALVLTKAVLLLKRQ